uniref:Integrase catalytic domain-containing protein n=1 Tax=Amphimedon queenslandica TaxID=400682 RepID=A0A1X7VW74_AMPQE
NASGGEFTSNEFEKYLRKGVKHELTILKCPRQNGVAERLNQTLVKMVRSMLSGAKLPQ